MGLVVWSQFLSLISNLLSSTGGLLWGQVRARGADHGGSPLRLIQAWRAVLIGAPRHAAAPTAPTVLKKQWSVAFSHTLNFARCGLRSTTAPTAPTCCSTSGWGSRSRRWRSWSRPPLLILLIPLRRPRRQVCASRGPCAPASLAWPYSFLKEVSAARHQPPAPAPLLPALPALRHLFFLPLPPLYPCCLAAVPPRFLPAAGCRGGCRAAAGAAA